MKEDWKTQKSTPASFSTVHNANLELLHTQLLSELTPWWRREWKVGTHRRRNIRVEMSLGCSWLFQARIFIRFTTLSNS